MFFLPFPINGEDIEANVTSLATTVGYYFTQRRDSPFSVVLVPVATTALGPT